MEVGNKRYAVLVGCSYLDKPEYELIGAVNDVLKMRNVLMSPRFRFEQANIALLVDTSIPDKYMTDMDRAGPSPMTPTRINILSKLLEKVRLARKGDVVFFYFSGHGTQIPGSVGRAMKTAITPCDYLYISDAHFRNVLNQLPEGASFTCLSDSCKTGGDLIDKAPERVGAPPPPAPPQLPNANPQLPNANHRIRMIPYDTVIAYANAQYNSVSQFNIASHDLNCGPLITIYGTGNANNHLIAISGTGNAASNKQDGLGNQLPLETGILLTGSQANRLSSHEPPHGDLLEGFGAFSNAVQMVLEKHPNIITNKQLVILTREYLEGVQYPCLYCSEENVNAPFLYQP